MVSLCRQPWHLVFMDPFKECVQSQYVHLVTLWNTRGKFQFCWKCSFSFQLLLLSPCLGAQSRSGCGQSCSGRPCRQCFVVPFVPRISSSIWLEPSQTGLSNQGKPPPQGLKSPHATPTPGWFRTVSEGQSVTLWHHFTNKKPERESFLIQAQNIFKAEPSVKATTYSFPGSNQQQSFIPQTLLNSDLPWGHF